MPSPAPARRPRVLALSSSPSNGGAERHALQLTATYQEAGGEIILACASGSFIEQGSRAHGLLTAPLQPRNSGDLRSALALARLLRTHRTELLHSHARRDFVTATLAGRLAHCPVTLHVHVVRPLGTPLGLAGRFFNQVQAIVAVSAFAQRELERWHPLRPGLVRRLYNGVPVRTFADATPLRHTWNLPEGTLLVGMVGRLTTKGQVGFLPVAERLAARYPCLRFVFAGPDAPSLTHSQFQALLVRHQLAERSVVLGMSEQVPQLMRSLDVLVHLPTDEAFGLALVEAAAAQVPVVAARVGGCSEVVEDGVTGYLVAPDQPEEQEARLRTLLESPTQRMSFGTAGQRRAEALFSFERQKEELCTLYAELSP